MDKITQLPEPTLVYQCPSCSYTLQGNERDILAHMNTPITDRIPKGLIYIDSQMSQGDEQVYGVITQVSPIKTNGLSEGRRVLLPVSPITENAEYHSANVRVLEIFYGNDLKYEPKNPLQAGNWVNGLKIEEMLIGDSPRGNLLSDDDFSNLVQHIKEENPSFERWTGFSIDTLTNKLKA